MRASLVMGLALALASAPALADDAKRGHGSHVNIHSDCNIRSDYAFHLTERSVVYTRDSGTPRRVLIRDGGLFVDDAWVTVGAADGKRLRDYERGAREAMPLAQRIGREAAQIALTAVGEVAAAFSNDPERTRDKLAEAQKRIDARLATAISPNRFNSAQLGEAIGDVVPMMVGDVVGGALRAAFSGDTARFERIEHDLDTRIDAVVEPRAKALERTAEAFCQRMEALDALDNALDYRLPDGTALSLLEVHRGENGGRRD